MNIASSVAARRAPGPSGMPLWGSLGAFRRDPIGLMMEAARHYGPLVRLKIGPVTAHLITDPELIERALVCDTQLYDKQTRSVAKIRATCGASLLSTDGSAWRRHRRIAQPHFQQDVVGRFLPEIVDSVDQMHRRWSTVTASDRRIDVVSEMMQVTLQIAARCLFGADIAPHAKTIEQSLAVILADTWRRLESWIDWAAFSRRFHRRAFRTAVREIDEVVFKIIAARRRGRSQQDNDLLADLLHARDAERPAQLSDQELRDACVTLLLAGHETTANALAWSFILLSGDECVAEELRREAATTFAGRLPDRQGVAALTCAGQVFAETLRLYPSIWIMERRVTDDVQLGGYSLRRGSTLLISPYVLHRQPMWWPNPEAFDPLRFAPEKASQRPRLAYLPFGAGPHQCIGRHLAPLIARVVLAMTATRFRLRLAQDQTAAPLPGITLRHAGEVEMTLESLPCQPASFPPSPPPTMPPPTMPYD